MPCPAHDHRPWPRSGTHVLRIEACETQCGWCGRESKAANNLRAHARCHVKNPNNAALSKITIHTGKAGRSRVSMPSKTTIDQQKDDDLETKLSTLKAIEEKIQILQADNDHLYAALQLARAENEKLRAAGTLTTTSLLSSAANHEGLEEDRNPMQQKLHEQSAPSPRRRESFSSVSENDRSVDHAIETGTRPMAQDQRSSVEPITANVSSQSERREGDIHSGRDGLTPMAPGSGLSPASNPENGAKAVQPAYNWRSYLPKLEANSMDSKFTCCGLHIGAMRSLVRHFEQTHAETPPLWPILSVESASPSALHGQEANSMVHQGGASLWEMPMTLEWDWADMSNHNRRDP
ncbi:hypothetical protein FB567DRAFT_149643 [Paraphoma chrysanthemicola]|uniref:C2H2-type domain-containing protein n=1 Tax=Paraphoma chrysanthemicola TaxID=798071 RepID=A0A8K0QYY1_9PLEO|nr:hypothetical protein FB567DRAFT_149643 [Paraphoma chrysanthemicola]